MTRLVTVLCLALCALPVCAQDPPPADELERWEKTSPEHAEIVAALRRLRPQAARSKEPKLEEFQARRKLEEEALKTLRGGEDRERRVQTLEDMLKQVEGRSDRIFLARALAGIEHPSATAATGRALSRVHEDVALVTTLVRFLPEGEASVKLLLGAWETKGAGPAFRTVLLRELARREPEPSDDYVALLARTIEAEPDHGVRGEAITVAGRLGDSRLKKPLAASAKREKHLQTRQRALVAYAEVAGAEAVPLLVEVASGEGPLNWQASAVLALGRIGGDEAREALKAIAEEHPAPEIKTRAEKLLKALEKSEQRD